jgi:PAS domain S-box-containing protein
MSPDVSELRQKIWLAVAMALVLPLFLGVTALIFFGAWPYPDALKIFYQYTGIYLLLVLFPVIKLTYRFIRSVGENINKSAFPINRFASTKHLLVILLCFELVYFFGVVVSGVLSIQDFGGRQYEGAFYVYSYFAGLPSVFLTVLCVFIYISDALGRYFATRGVMGNTTPLRLNMAVLGLLVPMLFVSTFLVYFYERTGHLTTETLVLSLILMVIAGAALYYIVNSLYKTSLSLQNFKSIHTNKESMSANQLEPDFIGEFGELAVEWKRLYEENIKTNLHLLESEQRLRQLVEYTSDWIWEVDTKGNLSYASPKIKELLGYEPEEVIGCSVYDLMPKQEAERVAIIYEELIKERKAFHGMININQHKDGHLVILESSGVPLFAEDGEWLGYRGIDRDISDRYRYEKELQQERNFIDAVIENAGAMVVVLDKQGKIQRFNRACEEVSLYTFEEVKGKYVWDFLLMPEEVEPVRNVFKKLEYTTLPGQLTNYWVAKDKSRHLIEWSNVVMTDAEGEYDYLISIGNDVTEKYLCRRLWLNGQNCLNVSLKTPIH